MLRHVGHIDAVDLDGAEVRLPDTGDGVLQCGLTGAVAADNGDEIAFFNMQVQTVQGCLGIDGAGVEGLLQIGELKHACHLLLWRSAPKGADPFAW